MAMNAIISETMMRRNADKPSLEALTEGPCKAKRYKSGFTAVGITPIFNSDKYHVNGLLMFLFHTVFFRTTENRLLTWPRWSSQALQNA